MPAARIPIEDADHRPEQDNLPSMGDISAPNEASPSLTPSSGTGLFDQSPASGPQSDSEPSSLFTPQNFGTHDDVGARNSNTGLDGLSSVPAMNSHPPTAKIPATEPSTGGGSELHVPTGHTNYHHKPRIWVWVLLVIIALASIYAAVDAKTDWLPFHIFNHDNNQPTTPANNSTSSNQSATQNQSTLPDGFTRYQPVGTPLTFAYPTIWGTPTTTTDPGFSQRGTNKKSDGAHAYLVNFATNKDVEIAITSSKYLPAARGALYYDDLQWCIGTADSKFYKSQLHFTTTAGVDSASTTTCDQGPLTDAVKINSAIIVQQKTKDAGGAIIGDVYTANLSDASLPVLRVKDAKMTNGDAIKQLLNTIAGSSNTTQ